MAFRWFRKGRPPPPPPDPIAAYDDLVSDLDAEAAELRRAAATLLTVRARLQRELAQGEATARALQGRADQARGDTTSLGVLSADVHRLERQAEGLGESLARTEADVAALKEAAGRVAEQVERLKAERDLAAARFTASSALATEAQRSRADRIRRLVAVDAARDEVERAHALAEVWREDGDAGHS